MNLPWSKRQSIRVSMLRRRYSTRRRRSRNGTVISRVLGTTRSIKFQCSAQPLSEIYFWTPIEDRARLTAVGVIVSDIDRYAISREWDHSVVTRAIQSNQQRSQILQGDGRRTAQVEHTAYSIVGARG